MCWITLSFPTARMAETPCPGLIYFLLISVTQCCVPINVGGGGMEFVCACFFPFYLHLLLDKYPVHLKAIFLHNNIESLNSKRWKLLHDQILCTCAMRRQDFWSSGRHAHMISPADALKTQFSAGCDAAHHGSNYNQVLFHARSIFIGHYQRLRRLIVTVHSVCTQNISICSHDRCAELALAVIGISLSQCVKMAKAAIMFGNGDFFLHWHFQLDT